MVAFRLLNVSNITTVRKVLLINSFVNIFIECIKLSNTSKRITVSLPTPYLCDCLSKLNAVKSIFHGKFMSLILHEKGTLLILE